MTISFAGKPRKNESKITPSNPIIRAKGSKKSAHIINKSLPFILVLASKKIRIPAGSATEIALPKTNKVR